MTSIRVPSTQQMLRKIPINWWRTNWLKNILQVRHHLIPWATSWHHYKIETLEMQFPHYCQTKTSYILLILATNLTPGKSQSSFHFNFFQHLSQGFPIRPYTSHLSDPHLWILGHKNNWQNSKWINSFFPQELFWRFEEKGRDCLPIWKWKYFLSSLFQNLQALSTRNPQNWPGKQQEKSYQIHFLTLES